MSVRIFDIDRFTTVDTVGNEISNIYIPSAFNSGIAGIEILSLLASP